MVYFWTTQNVHFYMHVGHKDHVTTVASMSTDERQCAFISCYYRSWKKFMKILQC